MNFKSRQYYKPLRPDILEWLFFINFLYRKEKITEQDTKDCMFLIRNYCHSFEKFYKPSKTLERMQKHIGFKLEHSNKDLHKLVRYPISQIKNIKIDDSDFEYLTEVDRIVKEFRENEKNINICKLKNIKKIEIFKRI